MRRDRGFTLTELLIVIAIIGILAGIILVSGGSVRRDARDKKRKADVEQIAGILQVKLAQDKNLNTIASPQNSTSGSFLQELINERYTTQIPRDPLPSSPSNYYTYQESGAIGLCASGSYAFAVVARLEGTSGNNSPCRAGPQMYVVVSN